MLLGIFLLLRLSVSVCQDAVCANDCNASFTQSASCPENRVTLGPGASSAEDCVCGPGGYGSMCSLCPGGFVCTDANTTLPIPCPSGTYCPLGSSESIVCPSRFVCGVMSASPTPCDAGFFCPLGSKQQLSCPAFAVCSEWGSAACSFGGIAPDCAQFCGNGSILYNNTCSAICPPRLDCGRRNANGSAPCLAGFEMVSTICVEEASGSGLSIPLIVGLSVAGVVIVAAATQIYITFYSVDAGSSSVAAKVKTPIKFSSSSVAAGVKMPKINLTKTI